MIIVLIYVNDSVKTRLFGVVRGRASSFFTIAN